MRTSSAARPERSQRSGTFTAKWLPSQMPGREPSSKGAEQAPVDVAEQPVAEAGDQGQRHGVGEVRADDAHRRKCG
jgi:hypothetical protein